MGTGQRRFEVVLREKKKLTFSKIQELALVQIKAPYSIWQDDPRAAVKARLRQSARCAP